MRKNVILLVAFFFIHGLYCQKKSLFIQFKDSIVLKKDNLTSFQAKQILDSVLISLQNKGFFDLVVEKKKDAFKDSIKIFPKAQFKKIQIIKPNNPFKLHVINALVENKKKGDTNDYLTLKLREYPTFIQSLLMAFQQNGYPFVKIYSDNITIRDNTLFAKLNIVLNKKRSIDKIVVKGYPKFPKKILKNYRRILHSDWYNNQNIQKIDNFIGSFSFLEKIKNPEVLFKKDSTILYLYYNKKKANSFDGLLGFQTDKENAKLQLHGYLNVDLINSFDRGNSFNLLWDNNGQQTSSLDVSYNTPYIYNSILSTSTNFKILKRDSLNLNIFFKEKMAVFLGSYNEVSLTYKYETSKNLLKLPTDSIQNFNKNHIGLGYEYKMPKQSYFEKWLLGLSVNYQIGNKKLLHKNVTEEIYDVQLFYNLNITDHIYLNNKWKYKKMKSDFILYNELFSLGGFDSLRGFKKNSIFSDAYFIWNTDLKWYSNNRSSFYVLSDFAILKALQKKNRILSFGLGYEFRVSNSGIIHLNYIISKENDKPYNKGVIGIKYQVIF